MESTLKKLESRIEEFIKAHQKAAARIAELEKQVANLEKKAGGSDDLADKVKALEAQRTETADRLEKVLGAIDSALDG
jgi:phage shock protein A